MPIFLAAAASSGASPAPAPGWLSDALAQALPIIPGATPEFELGIGFTVPVVGTCNGIRAYWQHGGAGPWSVTLKLYVGVGGLLAQETIVVSASNAFIQTTGLFGSHVLNPGFNYTVSLVAPGVFDAYGNSNPFTLPVAYPDYSVQASYVYNVGAGFPGVADNQYCALIEPLF